MSQPERPQIRYEERWEELKPTIVDAYLGHNEDRKCLTIPKLVGFMKERYDFKAEVHQYRHYFKKWGVRKRIITEEKEAIVKTLGKRSRPGASASDVTIHQGGLTKEVDKKQLKRFLDDRVRHCLVDPLFPGTFSRWNLPYDAYIASIVKQADYPSPFGHNPATPQYLNVKSPEATIPDGSVPGLTPTAALIQRKTLQDRSNLLLQGRREELLSMCNDNDRRIISGWLHDYWMHSFLTAKFWGRGPQEWTAGLVKEEAFTQSRFSLTSADQLPISDLIIAEAIVKSPEDLALDSWAFAIMAGNMRPILDKVYNEMDCDDIRVPGIGEIHPYHLAASFLDGGHTCCLVMNEIIIVLQSCHPIALNNVDSNGHTVLDSLMISVLRSHTDLTPPDVSTSFSQITRFPGEEKDVCGRWDADSPAIRQLQTRGDPRIPEQWKHNFCHSAVQAVIHNMTSIFGPPSSPNINTLSGLFGRRCTHCGLEMKLGPLHVLVVVAFYLAERGKDGETLFGALACLVCLLVLGASAQLTVDVSVVDILTSPDEERCYHRPINAMELAQQVPQGTIDRWNSTCKVGWGCFLLVLQRETMGFPRKASSSPREEEFEMFKHWTHDVSDKDDDHNTPGNDGDEESIESESVCGLLHEHDMLEIPCLHENIGIIWAAIQTEFLTYRKISSLDPNISENFQLAALEKWLREETDHFETPLVKDGMMKEHSVCGWFDDYSSIYNPTAADVCSQFFMNMDVWARASFIERLIPLDSEDVR
ncbi:hypothetical protein RB213_013142 [Colletotrichum asianum]